jgi:hypothetical protein
VTAAPTPATAPASAGNSVSSAALAPKAAGDIPIADSNRPSVDRAPTPNAPAAARTASATTTPATCTVRPGDSMAA